jgi:hypothetical protein
MVSNYIEGQKNTKKYEAGENHSGRGIYRAKKAIQRRLNIGLGCFWARKYREKNI